MTDQRGRVAGVVPPPLTGSFLALVADSAFSHLVIGTLTVLFWRGLWEYIGRNLCPDDPELSAWICSAVGNVGLVALALAQNPCKAYLATDDTGSWRWLVGYHLYTYLLGLLNVVQWRGLWMLCDIYIGVNDVGSVITLVIGVGVSSVFRCSKCTSAPPLVVDFDDDPQFFAHPGRFHQEKFQISSVWCVVDSIFTVLVLHHMTVLYWRAIWELLDVHLLPNDARASAAFTFLASFALHAFVCLLQPVFNGLYRRTATTQHPKVWQWLLEATIYSIGNPVCVTHWRGVWNLFSAYADPRYEDLIDLTTHLFSIGVLMLLMCGQSVATKGCSIDGNSPLEDGCLFPNKYIRHWIERRDSAEQGKRQQSLQKQQHDENQTKEKPFEHQSQDSRFLPEIQRPSKQQQRNHPAAAINGESPIDKLLPGKVSEMPSPIVLQITTL